ncbi:MAG: NADH-quinone oxidoreductase subunit J [Legionella sp.]|uniref:NADH-quinone oxidoreductase subunit J n=1 Tax=Legionella sp. TaxID=459 RepID=UPI0039E72533
MHDLLVQIIFYVFAALAVGSAFLVITQNNPVRCVLFLVLTFFCSAVLWILAEAEFLALILVLVYVGAVMTLFLFVVMMLNIDVESLKSHFRRYLPFGLIIVALFIGLLMVAIPSGTFKSNVEMKQNAEMSVAQNSGSKIESLTVDASNTEALGMVLYTDYFLAFELAAVLLLVAIVSAITLVHRGVRHSKRQDIKQQIMTRSSERVKLISMKAEK